MFSASRSLLRAAARPSVSLYSAPSRASAVRSYSAAPSKDPAAPSSETAEAEQATPNEAETKLAEVQKQLEEKNKLLAEMKDARLRSLADFENLQKISVREKQQAKDFALTSFAKDLISSIDIISLALRSIPAERLTPAADKDLLDLHQGVSLTKAAIEKVLKRHGVVPFDPVGQQFDPNLHEALYQAPVPGKEPGSVLECQEIGYMIKDRLLRPAKVGVVLSQES